MMAALSLVVMLPLGSAFAGRGDDTSAVASKIDKGGAVGAAANKQAEQAKADLGRNPRDQEAAGRLRQAEETRRGVDEFRDKAAAEYPDSFEIQQAAAGASVKEEDWGGALKYGEKSVALAADDPVKLPGALRNYSLAQLKTGDYAGAAASAKKALELKPADRRLASELMAIYQDSRGRGTAGTTTARGAGPVAATGTAPRAVEARPAPVLTTQGAAERLKANDFARQAAGSLGMDRGRAMGLLQKALALDPGNPEAHRLRAKIAVSDGDFRTALESLNRVIEAEPKEATALRERAVVGAALKERREEIEADYLASGGAAKDFSSFYDAAVRQASGTTGTTGHEGTTTGASAPESWWNELVPRGSSDWRWLVVLAATGLGIVGMRAVWRRGAGG